MVELFCFLKNGGDIDRVTVLPVVEASNDADEAAADATRALQRELGRFRVERARCSQERDTQKLLGCIVRARHSATLSLAHALRATPTPLLPWRGRRLGSASTSRSTRWCAASSPAGRAPPSVLQAPRMPFELEPSEMEEQLRRAAQVIQRHARRFIAFER